MDTITRSIYINPSPIAIFTNNYACENEAVDFIDNSFIASGSIVSWSWNFNNGQGNSILQNPSFIFGNEGSYPVLLTITSDSGCVDTLTHYVSVLGGPDAAFTSAPNPAVAEETVTFTDQSTNGPIVSWFWNYDDGNYGYNNPATHEYTGGGYYTVILEVTDTAGCTDTTSRVIQIFLEPALPTAFTPNGDGENDFYLVRGGPFESIDFKIFNNWGQLVYSTDDINHTGWDGTFNGTDAPLGVYTWTYTVIMSGGRQFIEEGDVTLMR